MIHLVSFMLASVSFGNIKTVAPKNDEIVEVKAALGIATIIQVPDSIQSAIIGDQSAYRIEYVDKAVTIKPLRSGARTNLYLFTMERRFSLVLNVVPQQAAYYIVYIKKADLGTGPRWISVNRAVSNAELSLKVNRIATTSDDFLLVDLNVIAKKTLKLQASDFWLLEGSDSKVINSIFLSKVELKKGQAAQLGISIRKSDLGKRPLAFEYRNSGKALRVDLLREAQWK